MRIELQLMVQPWNGSAQGVPAGLDARHNRFDCNRFARLSGTAPACLVHTAVLDNHPSPFRLMRQIGAHRPAPAALPAQSRAKALKVNFMPSEDFEVAIKEAT